MRFPALENVDGLGPHDFGEFGLRFKVNFRNAGVVASMEVHERIVKLDGSKRRCNSMAKDV